MDQKRENQAILAAIEMVRDDNGAHLAVSGADGSGR
jgi:hypothetical protein